MMECQKLFRVVLTKHPLVRNLVAFYDSQSLHLFGHCNKQVYISEFNLTDGLLPDKIQEFHGEVLEHSEHVVNVFGHNGVYYGVDQSGNLFTLSQDSSFDGNAEYDLFEDSPERTKKWVISRTTKITVNPFVLKTCVVESDRLACLTSSPDSISLEIIDITTFKFIKSILLRKPGLLEVSNKQECLVQWIPREKIGAEFLRSWFREGRDESGFFLATLPDGSILAVFPESEEIEYLYIWFSPFIYSFWEYSGDTEECCLWAWSKCGGWVGLQETGEVVRGYLPVAPTTVHLSLQHRAVYFSDRKDSFCQHLDTRKSLSLPLKGIVCWCGTGSHTLALSRTGQIYVVGDQFSQLGETTIQELLPNSSLTSELIRKNISFEMVNTEIVELDRYIMALVLSKKEMHFSLTVQMLSVRGDDYTAMVVMCLMKGEVLEKKDWTLRVRVGGGGGTWSSAHRLPTSLHPSRPLSFPLNFHYPHKEHPTFFQATFIFSHLPPRISYLPTINIGKVEMDPSYFLLPAVELDIERVPHVPELEDLMSTFEGCITNKTSDQETNKVITTVNLSKEYPEESVFKNLLNNSKALWRASQWEKACGEKELEIAVCNKLVKLEVGGGTVKVSGEDISSCLLTKQALLSSGRCTLAGDPQGASHIEDLACWSEVLLGQEESEQQLEELRTLLRTKTNSIFLLSPR